MITRPIKVLRPFERGEVPQSQEDKDASSEKDAKKDTIRTKRKLIICRSLSLGADDQGGNRQELIDNQKVFDCIDPEVSYGVAPEVSSLHLQDDASPKPEEIEVPNPRKDTNPPDPNLNDTPPGPDPNDTPPCPDPNDTPPGPDPNLNPP